MQDDRRRYLLYCLQEENACELDEAARRVAALDQGYDVGDVPSRSQDRLELELYHIHLPKLKDLNIVDYDERSGSIRFQDPPDRLDAFLDLAREADELE